MAMEIGGYNDVPDWPKMGPSLLIATCLIVAIRTCSEGILTPHLTLRLSFASASGVTEDRGKNALLIVSLLSLLCEPHARSRSFRFNLRDASRYSASSKNVEGTQENE